MRSLRSLPAKSTRHYCRGPNGVSCAD
jgi:hypothetical protein